MALFEILGSYFISKALIKQNNENNHLRNIAINQHKAIYYDTSGYTKSTLTNRPVIVCPLSYGFEMIKDAQTGIEIGIQPTFPELTMEDYGKTKAELWALVQFRASYNYENHKSEIIDAYLQRDIIQILIKEKMKAGFCWIPWPIDEFTTKSKRNRNLYFLNYITKDIISWDPSWGFANENVSSNSYGCFWKARENGERLFDTDTFSMTAEEIWETGYLPNYKGGTKYDSFWKQIVNKEKELFHIYYNGDSNDYLSELKNRQITNEGYSYPALKNWAITHVIHH